MEEAVIEQKLLTMATGATLTLLPAPGTGAALARVGKLDAERLSVDQRTFASPTAAAQCARYLAQTYPAARGVAIFKVM